MDYLGKEFQIVPEAQEKGKSFDLSGAHSAAQEGDRRY